MLLSLVCQLGVQPFVPSLQKVLLSGKMAFIGYDALRTIET